MFTRCLRAGAAVALIACPTPALAQDEVVTPIAELERLAEIIGGAHQIRQLCDRNDQVWREQMLALIEMEARDDNRRQRVLIDAFNAGYRNQERRSSRCNAEARQAETELAAEGRRLAEDLRDRYLQ